MREGMSVAGTEQSWQDGLVFTSVARSSLPDAAL